ncbi:uncharacterized protein RHIMIDRAFT_246398 [Rhizopus microsporus ATCC 52813]|uniref:BTB domain-containing protein n=2 Tax=Rhizopus microsporus TaxID=58291 RepID=A0A2G4SK13_RHIZD|nr:uncharacterized protein RHIMIDRAFT_246398 [Rhizopus microsporus ATCC 52813]PHZ09101.1 hypothetical protein RHIMIDRAFT_246398 [Rhizopus microsporus ATCC 52813]
MTTLERHLLECMFEQSLFSDLSLEFLHPSFPFSIRFNVHKAIVSQSPFLRHLLTEDNTCSNHVEDNGKTYLTVHLAEAFSQCGFVLVPFQHIIRRHWQAADKQQSKLPLLSTHLRFVLEWLYSTQKTRLLEKMQDQDTLRILSVAVLFNLVDLTQACIQRYTQHQLSLDSIMRDLETICQLPRGHKAYLQLRDAALLLLFRYGPQHPRRLSELPSDYMADVLSADLLFVRSEYERYCLLKSVLTAFMQSIGKITWTPKGPVDQDSKRLSGFVKPLTAASVREVKRRRIGSDELEGKVKKIKTNRLSFTALVPFEKLTADVASGGVIDKATVLSYLLKTTIHYSNMTFEQLTAVRQDGIVDEAIVFRALWQREALERVLFPYTTAELTAALDDYFDLHPSDTQRKKLLLGTPRFRFCTSIIILPPSEQNGWVTDDVFEDEGGEEETKMWRSDDEDIKVLKKTFYSATETILGVSYRVQIEAQTASQKNCIACRFELQRDVKKSKSNESQEEKTLIEVQSDHWKSKIHYWIHCLNRHEGITDTCEVDPEDRVLLAATEQREGEPNVGYIGQVLLEFDKKEGVTVDMTVALELFGFPQV